MAEPLARHRIPADGIEVPGAPGTLRAETGSRLATALLAYVAAVTAVVTLLPFQFAIPSQPRVMLTGGLVDRQRAYEVLVAYALAPFMSVPPPR